MAQVKEIVWTNTSGASTALPVEIGFVPTKVTVIDVTTGNVYYWYDGMAQGSYIEVLGGGNYPTYQTAGGFQWMGDVWLGGMGITSFTAPTSTMQGSIGVTNSAWFNLQPNSTIKVVGAVCTPAANAVSVNGTYSVQSVSSGVITLNTPNPLPTYQTYVSGGVVIPLTNACGQPYSPKIGCYGCVLGANMVGTAGAQARAIFESCVSVT